MGTERFTGPDPSTYPGQGLRNVWFTHASEKTGVSRPAMQRSLIFHGKSNRYNIGIMVQFRW